MAVRFGLGLGRARPDDWADLARCADECGYESVWMPEHLVLPASLHGSPAAGHEAPSPHVPVFDAPAYLCHLAAVTERVRLGTQVYLAALRHPFTVARAFCTLDVVSGGRALAGVGAGWLEEEFVAAGVEFTSRGRRLDEVVSLCRRLWSEEIVAHDGEFFRFPSVVFAPKPVQPGGPPLLVGGESRAALRRAASTGDGWLAMTHSPDDVVSPLALLRDMREEAGRAATPFSVTVSSRLEDPREPGAWEDLGVDRVIVAPWDRPRDALAGTRAFADRHIRP